MSSISTFDLPDRVVVDEHGHYWLDWGSHWSMAPATEANERSEPRAVYMLAATSASVPPLDERDALTLSAMRSHAFPKCEVCGASVDNPEGWEPCDPFTAGTSEQDR